MLNVEKYNKEVFDSLVIDELMRKLKITEIDADRKLYEMYNSIDIFSKECESPNGYSFVRYAIMNILHNM